MSSELQDLFLEAYGQSHVSEDALPKNIKGKRANRNVTSQSYSDFLRKYENLDKYIDSFKPQDLTYFFREKARENNNYYTICNMKRDMGIYKKLLTDYTSMEICLMIEFLFESGQSYLPVKGLQPTVLASTWCNTIYADTKDWLDDKFDPNKSVVRKKHISEGERRNTEREWHREGKKKDLGDWE